MSIRRIDPSTIPGLFEKHELRPMQMGFAGLNMNGHRCACVNTVLAAEVSGRDKAFDLAKGLNDYLETSDLANMSGINAEYALGLAEGWDGSDFCRGNAREAELLGMEDGRAAWEACQPLLSDAQ